MVEKLFQIGNFCFCLQCKDGIVIPENLIKFQVESGKIMYTYRVFIKETLPKPMGTMLIHRDDLRVYETKAGEERILYVPGIWEPYAVYREKAEDAAEIFVAEAWRGKLCSDTIFNSLLALEKRILACDGLILHCAYLSHNGEAILFSGPSETGKSTQAHLWEKYRDNSDTVNGDRALLQKIGGCWAAHGWPVCGDSGICNHGSLPIRAIVMLSQGEDNRVTRLQAAAGFQELYGQITVNRWNRNAVNQSVNLLENLAMEVPIYHLSCTISEEAVACLEEAVYGKGI